MELVKPESTTVARPLKILAPLIREDLKQGDEAAKNASMPWYIAAGEKLIEARDGTFKGRHSAWIAWATKEFKRSRPQLLIYVRLAAATLDASAATDYDSLKDFRRRGLGHDVPTSGGGMRQPAWQAPIKEAIGRVNVEALKQDALARAGERELQRKLALSLIDIGYKALATKLHPDKGGSREAMMRLNRVRDLLKGAVT